ncbi:hypothetical protein Amsp01_079790 [Amycolatopsis sp. NBRC 101858]|uniref:DUF2255 family protein n=1 Tax=Amycolatopsis sp. NBRC 101858 TaxID=3032200 RepID=UPI0024A5865B|nr:DUF2255 family protein [Amycolatopsis sp. NBRC 101858]GLY41956.1 hypothetical protein Amsp01_079790 [Amycolatopsis sp. NBRC 101858]
MSTWTPEDLTLLAESYSLVLTAGDGDEPGAEIGMAVAGGAVYVRAHRGVRSRWYRAASEAGHGRIRVGGVTREVRLTTGPELPAGLDAAFAGKYGPVSETLVASPQARAATIRIDPAA